MKIEFFVSHVCPDSPPAIEIMETSQYASEAKNITGSIPVLKSFLNYRDRMPAFAPLKEANYLGVPALILDDGAHAIFDFDSREQVEAAIEAYLESKK